MDVTGGPGKEREPLRELVRSNRGRWTEITVAEVEEKGNVSKRNGAEERRERNQDLSGTGK